MGLFDRLTGSKQPQAQQGCVGLPIHFSIVDIETTGLDPARDRIVEIAIVIMDTTGRVVHEWATLVNPGTGSSGPEHIHGIKSEWLSAAPTFGQIVGDLRDRVVGRVFTAHNSAFDSSFIEAELRRASVPVAGPLPSFDTMGTAGAAGLARSLRGACSQLGIEYQPHDALEDARAAGRLLTRLLPLISPSSFPPAMLVPVGWIPPVPLASGVTRLRQEAAALTQPNDFLVRAATLLPPFDPSVTRAPDAFAAYRSLVADAIADGYVSPEESQELFSMAASLSISTAEARDLHHDLFLSLLDTALLDRKLSKDEKADLEKAAGWLGVDISDWDALVKAARARVKDAQFNFRSEMAGKVVAFTGRGVHPNNVREGLCAKLGILFKTTVSKETALLVVGSLDNGNANVAKAHESGIPIMLEATFWQRLGEM